MGAPIISQDKRSRLGEVDWQGLREKGDKGSSTIVHAFAGGQPRTMPRGTLTEKLHLPVPCVA
jgi:hypothetical protein